MQIELSPELARRVEAWQARSGRPASEFIADALTGYLPELDELSAKLQRRYQEAQSGSVQMLDGPETMSQMIRKAEQGSSTLL